MIPYIVTHAIIVILAFYILLYIVKHKLDWFRKRLEGKHVLITGGTSGIGKAIAEVVVKNGANVTVVARSCDKLQETVMHLQNFAKRKQIIKYVSLDCCDGQRVTTLLGQVDNALPVYMLVNCAGCFVSGLLEDMDDAAVRRAVEGNLYAALYPTRALLGRMKGRGEGAVVITGAQTSLTGLYGHSLYAAAKFALRGLAESLDMEARDRNVSVTLAVPPDTETPGYALETKAKPLAAQIISDTAGIHKAENVAKKIVSDALDGHFFSSLGVHGFCLTMLCAGLSPGRSVFEFFFQVLFAGLLRLLGVVYLGWFHRVVSLWRNDGEPRGEIGAI